jgi:carboxypeptidase family protein
MRLKSLAASLVMAALSLALRPDVAAAQAATSSIAGVVKDASGGVIPGVTVEAASPVLIEKVRSVTTDAEGQFKIVDLRPGLYTVTFTLGGFSTVQREGIEIPPGFTATVNADLHVGAIEETLTVKGASPVVDVQTNSNPTQLSQDVLEALPAQRNPNAIAPLVPGVTLSTGGVGTLGVFGGTFTVHGSPISSTSLAIDGFETNSMAADGAGFIYYINQATVQESSVTVGAEAAELQKSGVRHNIIPKTGSNRFSGFLFAGGSNHSLQASNLTDSLRASGLTAVTRLDKMSDINPAWGGPIVKDKLWFYNAFRYDEETDLVAGLYYNATPLAWAYTPSIQQAGNTVWDKSANIRLTWQVSQNNRVSANADAAPHCTCNRGSSATVSPEATQIGIFWPNYFAQTIWRYTPTTRVLLEAGMGSSWGSYSYNRQPGVPLDAISVTEQSTGLMYRANTTYGQNPTNPKTMRLAMTYVTGSHAAKFGFSDVIGRNIAVNSAGQEMSYRFLNGVPNQVTLYAEPSVVAVNMNADMGVYAQDRWTIRHLTLNLGVRYDHFNGSSPVQDEAALLQEFGLFTPPLVPVQTYPAVENTPNWNDVSPRLGAVYDLFGDGKTAVKVSVGRYVTGQTTTIATANNPITRSVVTATRTWTDSNRDYVVNCDLLNPVANNECTGAISNVNFGKANPNATQYADDVTHANRPYSWELEAGIQRELAPGWSLTGTYYRRWFGNFTVTQNTATSPTDYTTYCITAPIDSRLPGGGGDRICGYYDVNPNKFGQVTSLVTQASNFGSQQSVWDGFGVTTTMRLPRGVRVQGGVDDGRLRTNNCYALNQPQLSGLAGAPNIDAFCDVRPPFQAQVKLLGVYPLPWYDIMLSAAYQNLPGPQITATYTATNAQIAPSLGRNLSAGANGTATLSIIPPGMLYGGRVQELDFSLRKRAKIQSMRVTGSVDVYNVLNRSDITGYNTTFGPVWLRPTNLLSGRWVKFGVQLDF